MKFINKKVEAFSKKVSADQALESERNAREIGYEIDTNVAGCAFDGHKRAVEYVSNKKYEDVLNGNTISYLYYWNRADSLNKYVYNKIAVSYKQLVIEAMQKKIESHICIYQKKSKKQRGTMIGLKAMNVKDLCILD